MNIINKYRALKNWIRTTFKEKMLDQKLNRELVGEDRMGNKYYQYYSPWGLPTRREIEFANKKSYEMNDLAFYFWLNKREEIPPTEEQIKQYYLEEADRKMKGLEWDNNERKMMEQFYLQRFKIIQQTEVNRRLGLEEDEKDRLLRLEAENQKKISDEQQSSNVNLSNIAKDQFEPTKWKPQAKGRRGQTSSEE